MSGAQRRVPLRRGVAPILLLYGNFMVVGLIVTLVVGGIAAGEAAPVVVGMCLVPITLHPLLANVVLEGDTLVFGYVFRRRQVDLREVETVWIGQVQGWGLFLRGAMAMVLETHSGQRIGIRESEWCSRQRLRRWAEEMRRHQTALRIHESHEVLPNPGV